MQRIDTEPTSAHPAPALSSCPQCDADLAILRVIPGRGGAEYWTMRCTACGGIHLNVVQPAPAPLTA